MQQGKGAVPHARAAVGSRVAGSMAAAGLLLGCGELAGPPWVVMAGKHPVSCPSQ